MYKAAIYCPDRDELLEIGKRDNQEDLQDAVDHVMSMPEFDEIDMICLYPDTPEDKQALLNWFRNG
jgi:hypothetical protein